MKTVELKLISELMKNSRRSDRELASVIGVSQPTVSRMIGKLQKEGVIREYTMIPDFNKLGFRILALTFVKLRKTLSEEELEKAREITKRKINESAFAIVMLERGLGLGYDGVIMAFYRDYSEHLEHRKVLQQYPFLDLNGMESFLISLDDKIHYRLLTLSALVKNELETKKKNEDKLNEK
jgi:DNA-binding Lrp family transcriptional regulator